MFSSSLAEGGRLEEPLESSGPSPSFPPCPSSPGLLYNETARHSRANNLEASKKGCGKDGKGSSVCPSMWGLEQARPGCEYSSQDRAPESRSPDFHGALAKD